MDLKELIIVIRPYLIGLVVGIIIGTVISMKYYESSYVKLYPTNIGGFVFFHNKIYSLSELKNI
jgi:hypothetical protein